MNTDYVTKKYEEDKASAKTEKELAIIEAKYKMFLASIPKESK